MNMTCQVGTMRIVTRGFLFDVLFACLTICLALWKELGSKRKQQKARERKKKGKFRLAGQIRPVLCGKRVVECRAWICWHDEFTL